MDSLKDLMRVKFKLLRKTKGLSQQALAELVDRSQDSIYAIESGRAYPSFETIERMCDKLGLEIKDFFEFENNNKNLKRSSLLFKLLDAGRSLDTKTLEIAVKQVEVFKLLDTKSLDPKTLEIAIKQIEVLKVD